MVSYSASTEGTTSTHWSNTRILVNAGVKIKEVGGISPDQQSCRYQTHIYHLQHQHQHQHQHDVRLHHQHQQEQLYVDIQLKNTREYVERKVIES